MVDVMWTATSTNKKTGNIPTGWVGKSYLEAKETCDAVKCPLRPWDRQGEITCYAWGGTPAMALASMVKSSKPHTLEHALDNRTVSAKVIRIGAIGDPGVLSWGWWYKTRRLAKKNGLEVIAYTHAWRTRPDLAGMTMASCDTEEEAAEAMKMGFRVAIASRDYSVTDKGILINGKKAIVCPEMSKKGSGITCNTCRLCVASKPGPVIVFPDHGPNKKRA